MSYECHITMQGDKGKIEPLVKAAGWSFSAIDNDPVLGKGIKCYATSHFHATRPQEQVQKMMNSVSAYLKSKGVEVIREKIEVIVYDTKTNKKKH